MVCRLPLIGKRKVIGLRKWFKRTKLDDELYPHLVNRERLYTGFKLIIVVTVAALVMMLLAIIFGTLSQVNWQSSVIILDFRYPMDWGVFVYELLMLIGGAGLSWFYVAKRRDRRAWFWLGNLGWLAVISAGGSLILQLMVKTFGNLSLAHVKQAVTWTTWSNYVLLGIIPVLAVFALWFNRPWYAKNNWYVFAVAAPYIMMESIVYRTTVAWNSFVHMKEFDTKTFYNMLNAVQHNGTHAHVDLALLSDALQQNEMLMFIIGGLFLIYGGVGIVWKVNEKLKKD